MMPQRFRSFLADTAEAQTLHHHLRYKVYCERKHYERGIMLTQLPQERDEYDIHSIHFIIKDLMLDSWIGTARLVPNDGRLMPVQLLGAVDNHHNRIFARQGCAEVSRLATVSPYASVEVRASLLQTVILCALGQSQTLGVEWLIFLVSAGLARMLEHLGVPMEPCGKEVEHRGIRRAYRSHVESGIDQVSWARCLRHGNVGYELYSMQEAAAAA